MTHFQYGDHVMVYNEESPHNFKTGTICSIDIYGNIKVIIQDDRSVIEFKREELKLLSKKINPTHYMDSNKSFIHYLRNKYQMRSNLLDRPLRMEQLKQLIDLALDIRDQTWFEELSRQLKALSQIRDG